MGFLDRENEEDEEDFVEEVSISAAGESDEDNKPLKKEAEKKFNASDSSSGSRSGTRSRSNSNSMGSKSISLEEVHRQNEKIISMLEDLQGSEEDENSETNVGGAMDGVL